jgi:hypothetical protein
MTARGQTLTKIQSLAQLYQAGYHSETVDTTIDKLVAIERARLEREATDLGERLASFEEQYQRHGSFAKKCTLTVE